MLKDHLLHIGEKKRIFREKKEKVYINYISVIPSALPYNGTKQIKRVAGKKKYDNNNKIKPMFILML